MEHGTYDRDRAEGAQLMKEIAFQRTALEQSIRLAKARAAREASEPPSPVVDCVVEQLRSLLVSRDQKAKTLVTELRVLQADVRHTHSETLAKFMLDFGGILNSVEQNILLNTAGLLVDHKPLERRRQRILKRILQHAAAAGIVSGGKTT